MTQFTSKTFANTYRDDFDQSDNYHRILFNSGRALQARELTQLQTIIQTEIARLGRHIFKDGAAVNPGGVTVNTNYEFIKLDTSSHALPDNIADLVGVEYSTSNDVRFRILEVVREDRDPPLVNDPATLFVSYTNTNVGSAGADPVRVSPEDELTSAGHPTLTVQTMNSETNPAVGVGCKASIHAGDFFAENHFVYAPDQALIIDKYFNAPTVNLGFIVREDTVEAGPDTEEGKATALFDNQGVTPNLASPGADRYRIRLEIATSDEVDSDENFIEVAKIVDGVIVAEVEAGDDYNRFNDVLAQRTREESGDYIVKPFELTFDTNDADDTKIDFTLSSGIAYVDGYRAETAGDTVMTVSKPRTTIESQNAVVAANYGNYVIVERSGSMGLPDIRAFERFNLHSGSTSIGNARVRHVFKVSPDNFRFYLFNIRMDTGKKFADVDSLRKTGKRFDIVTEFRGQLRETSANNLLFDLPLGRPRAISDINLTVQRRLTGATGTDGELSLSLTVAGETFTNPNDWVMARSGGEIENRAGKNDPTGAGSQSSRIIGLTADANDYEVLAYVSKTGSPRNKNLATFETPANGLLSVQNGVVTLGHTDIFEFLEIRDGSSTGADIRALFETDNGQRDDFYDRGRLILISGNTAPSNIYVKYRHFNHTRGDFFCINSYPVPAEDDNTSFDPETQIRYADIPSFTKSNGEIVSLRNVLDFRSSVNDIGEFVRNEGVNALPQPNANITFDVGYYQGQAAKVSIDINGEVDVLLGDASIDPQLPKSPNQSMDLYNVIMNPYMIDDNDLRSQQLTYKRFTMADIGRLEQRVADLEETTALSLLELETANLEVLDGNGVNRHKAGFFVDNFKDQSRSLSNSPAYRAAIDPTRKELRPSFSVRNTNLIFNADHGDTSNVVRHGDNIYLNYTSVDYLQNNSVTGWENVNPFSVVRKRGVLTLSPQSDEWFETEFAEPIVVDGGFQQGSVSGRVWDDWSFNWSGVDNLTPNQSLATRSGDVQLDTSNQLRTASSVSTPRFRNTRNVRVSGIRTNTEFIDEEGVEVSRTFIPFMRTRKVFFRAQGLKPNTRYFPFFSKVNVANWVRSEQRWQRTSEGDEEFGTGFNNIRQHPDGPSDLTSSPQGEIIGSFFIPNSNNPITRRFRAGDRTFTLIDINELDEDKATSLAAATYYAQGVRQRRQQTVLSTRLVDIEATQTRTPVRPDEIEQIRRPAIPPRQDFRPRPRRGFEDPLAQTFIVTETSGVFITGLSLRFRSKPESSGVPVSVELRPVVNGIPSATHVIPGTRTFKSPDAVTTSDDGKDTDNFDAKTAFDFEEPVYLTGGVEHAIVVLSDSDEYEVYVAEAGAFLLGSTERRLTRQATLGSLFKSQNGTTWEPDQTKDMAFQLRRAKFTKTDRMRTVNGQTITENIAVGTAIIENSSPGKVNLTNALRTQTADPDSVTVFCRDHGFAIDDSVTIADADDVGGITAANINGTRTVTAADYDSFTFEAGMEDPQGRNASSATTGGGDFTIERQNIFETMMVNVENILPPATSVVVKGKTTSGKAVGASDEVLAYQKDDEYTAFPINRNITFKGPRLLATTANAGSNSITGGRSATFAIEMSSAHDTISPVIDMQRTSLSTIHNRINQNQTGANADVLMRVDETNALGGTALASHLTRPVTLADQAQGLRILLAANVHPETSFDVYYRTNGGGGVLPDQDFTKIDPEDSLPKDENPAIFRDYRYLPGGQTGTLPDFDQFQVKIVMRSPNPAHVPRFGDLRIIALTA